jgi:RimJ/RimL family protein N-acetyltransferase
MTNAVNEASTVRLVVATPAHLDWVATGDESARFGGVLRLPPGGLESPAILAWLKRTAASVEAAILAPSAWLIIDGEEAVGLISYKAPPRNGAVEIGYGVAASRRARGYATRAVACLVAEAAARGLDLIAETSVDNRPSQVVLERNGFVRRGERHDPEAGALLLWQRERQQGATIEAGEAPPAAGNPVTAVDECGVDAGSG